jgi:hypothetical protein
MKNMILLIALPFILGCTATAQTTPSKQPKTNRVETFSQLDSTEPAERPNWLQIVPESDKGFYFVGMSTKRTEKRHARNESFNDALIGFARYCGLNVQYLSEHRDTSIGGNGGLIDTFSNGNTIAKMQAEMLLGNVSTKDRYTEKYSNFYGGSFMGHAFVDSTLIYVPKEEMDLCRENRKQANTFLAQKTKKIKQLEVKNELLENQLVVEKQNTSVALAQAQQSSKFFKQVLTKPTHNVVKNKPVFVEPEKELIAKSKIVSRTKNKTKNTCEIVCNGLVAFYPFNGGAIDESGNGNNGRIFGAELTYDRNGNQNQAYRFTGKRNSYISIPKIGVENGDFTIATIVKANKKPIGNSEWVDSGIIWASGRGSYTGLKFVFMKNGNTNTFLVAGKSPLVDVPAGIKNPLQYTFLIGVVNKSEKTVSIYVNGKFKRKKQWNGDLNGSSIKSWIIGGRGPMTDRYHKGFNGDIDEVRIYNRTLSPTEIKTLYRGNSTELASL